MKAPALIVVDMLNDFLQAWAPASTNDSAIN